MMGIDWDTLAAGAQPDGGVQSRRSSVKTGMNGQAPGLVDGAGVMGGAEASSAWFMPFNMEPPEMGRDSGFNMGGGDPFAGMFSGGSGLATPDPLSGLQQQGP